MRLFKRSRVKRQKSLVIIECKDDEQAKEMADVLRKMQETRMLFDTELFNQKLERVTEYIKEDK